MVAMLYSSSRMAVEWATSSIWSSRGFVDTRGGKVASRKGRKRRSHHEICALGLACEFIKVQAREYPIQTMRQILEITPSEYYQWLDKPQSDRALQDAQLLRLSRASCNGSHGIYGAPRTFLRFAERDGASARVGAYSRDVDRPSRSPHHETTPHVASRCWWLSG